MADRRSYTAEEKQAALDLYVEVGPREAARRLDMPLRTLANWAERAGVSTDATPEKTRMATAKATAVREAKRAEKRERLRDLLLDKAVDMLERMDAPHYAWTKGKEPVKIEYEVAEADQCKSYATATGILIDKYRLEVGESTGRFEQRMVREQVEADAEGRALRLVS